MATGPGRGGVGQRGQQWTAFLPLPTWRTTTPTRVMTGATRPPRAATAATADASTLSVVLAESNAPNQDDDANNDMPMTTTLPVRRPRRVPLLAALLP